MKNTPLLAKVLLQVVLANANIPEGECALAMAHDDHPHAPLVLTEDGQTELTEG